MESNHCSDIYEEKKRKDKKSLELEKLVHQI